MTLRSPFRTTAAVAACLALAACGSGAGDAGSSSSKKLTLTNCGKKITMPDPAKRVFVNDGNMIAMMLALKAQGQVAGVSSLQRDAPTLRKKYGSKAVDGLKVAAPEYPTMETVLAQKPDAMVAGWNYGYSEDKKLTPDTLRAKGIDPYILTESCRQTGGKKRGVTDPWTALRTDLTNLGKVTGHEGDARRVLADLDTRLGTLRKAPKATTPPKVFLFDSGEKEVFSSGRFGAPHAIIGAAGGKNALGDVSDTWTSVSWERVARSEPDAFVFVDYPPQTFAQKVRALRTNPATKNLPAVKKGRFLNLPYVMWTSSPLNIDASERLRTSLEKWKLVPTR